MLNIDNARYAEDLRVRERAIVGLGSFLFAGARPDIVRNADGSVREDVKAALVEAATQDASNTVRVEALQTLCWLRIEDQEAWMIVLDAVCSDHDAGVRVYLASALEGILSGSDCSTRKAQAIRALEHLARSDPEEWVRSRAAKALERFEGHPQ